MRTRHVMLCSALIAAIATLNSAFGESKVNPPQPAAVSAKATAGEGTPAVIVDDDKVESLLGKIVKGASGEKLGAITDILVSHGGAVRSAVIDFGGFLGVGTRKVAVAWSALRFSADAIALDMTRDQLRVTPEFREGEPIVIVGDMSPSAPSPQRSSAKPSAIK